ncbi:hypothetical protein BV898_01787 [Hypsibius exemplaris]|uniref:Uncharacterized protein n=1 Tax=Hypsibius exemplaris TaxID=2072580 RepID=A0A1W0X9P1_HYPEX|nr:hypothetical protein BV898_01787 [Hypsibius exemplaris]
MLSSLFSGGGFGGGGGGGGGGGFGGGQNGGMMTGFEADPTLSARAGGSALSSPGGLFGGLMGLLSRGPSGGSALAPLLLDVDGDLLRSQLWNRGVMNGPGAGSGSGGAGGAGDGSNAVKVAGSPRETGGPMGNSGAGGYTGSNNSPNKPKSMPHMALPFDIEFTGSALGPVALEGNNPAAGAEATMQTTSTVKQTSPPATP